MKASCILHRYVVLMFSPPKKNKMRMRQFLWHYLVYQRCKHGTLSVLSELSTYFSDIRCSRKAILLDVNRVVLLSVLRDNSSMRLCEENDRFQNSRITANRILQNFIHATELSFSFSISAIPQCLMHWTMYLTGLYFLKFIS